DYRLHQAAVGNYLGVQLRHVPKEAETAVGHHRQAIKLCELLVAQFPDEPRYRGQLMNGHWGLGLALMASGRWTQVEASFQQALAGWVSLGLADEAARPADQDPPVAPSVRNDLAWLLATCPDVKVRDPQRAVALAKKAVELDPRASYFNTLGAAQYRAGNFTEALAALRKSMDLTKGGDSFDWFI